MAEDARDTGTTRILFDKKEPVIFYTGLFSVELRCGVGENERHKVSYRQNVLGLESFAVDGERVSATLWPRWRIRRVLDVGVGERHVVRIRRTPLNRIRVDVDGKRLVRQSFPGFRFFQASLYLALCTIVALLWILTQPSFGTALRADDAPRNADLVAFCELAKRQGVLIHALDRGSRSNMLGSGVVIQRIGETCFVLTAKHVVEGFLLSRLPVLRLYEGWTGDWDQLTRETGQKHVTERYSPIIYRDTDLDLAILVMRDPSGRAVPAAAASVSPLRGNWVLAMGNPGRGSVFQDRGKIVDFLVDGGRTQILHDAVIEHGSSGGPLYNRHFELIGINVKRWPPGRSPMPGTAQELAGAVSVKDLLDRVSLGAVEVPAMPGDTRQGDKVTRSWVDCGVAVKAGQTVYMSARGYWTVDEKTSIETVRRCDAGGFSDRGKDYLKERLITPCPLGCLLIAVQAPGAAEPEILGTFDDARAETVVVGRGGLRTSWFTTNRAGRLVARINDLDVESNGGHLELAVVVR